MTDASLGPKMTRQEFNALPSNGAVACPDCGSQRTTPYPGCGCPEKQIKVGYPFTEHINQWHHRCEKVTP
jgi:hypothetical protein